MCTLYTVLGTYKNTRGTVGRGAEVDTTTKDNARHVYVVAYTGTRTRYVYIIEIRYARASV